MPEVIEPADVRHIAMAHAVHLHAETLGLDGDGPDDGRLVETYRAIHRALTEPVPDPTITALQQRITHLETAMTSMEGRMDDTAQAIAELNAETDALATRIDTIIDTADAETAAALAPIRDRLRTLAADPAEPVPPEEPPAEPIPGA